MPSGSGRPLNKGARVMNRNPNLPYGAGTRAQELGTKGVMGNMPKQSPGKLKTQKAAKDFDSSFKKGYKPPLKTKNYGPGK